MSELAAALPDRVRNAAHAVMRQASDAGLGIVTAESCTGGLLASLLTDLEGVSGAFERGFVVYSPEAKCELLGIARETVDRCGAVSRNVALAMAEGALKASHGHVALAITGFAGAAGPDDEPGLVHLACVARGTEPAHREAHFGDIGRGPVRAAAIEVALELLAQAVAHVR